jgi:hypothetical protein
MEIGELYDIEHDEEASDEESLGSFTLSFSSEKQFRWEDESKEINETFPLYSSNLRVPFTMKGGFFSQLALIVLQYESDGTEIEVIFYNKELDRSYDVQISKEVDNNGNSYGRFVAVF